MPNLDNDDDFEFSKTCDCEAPQNWKTQSIVNN